MSAGRAFRVALLAALTVSTAVLFVRVLLAGSAQPGACGVTPPTHGPIPGAVMAGAAVVSFFVGGLVAGWRVRAAGAAPYVAGDVAVHAVLAIGLAAVAVALGYETFALAHPASAWPITYYVRCANVIAPGWSLLGLAATSGLFGHWFWQPIGR